MGFIKFWLKGWMFFILILLAFYMLPLPESPELGPESILVKILFVPVLLFSVAVVIIKTLFKNLIK